MGEVGRADAGRDREGGQGDRPRRRRSSARTWRPRRSRRACRRTAPTGRPPACRRRRRCTSTAASTPTAAIPRACANGSRTQMAGRVAPRSPLAAARVRRVRDDRRAAGAAARAARPATRSGAPLPAIKVESLAGKKIDVASYRGRVLLLDVWASWCGPCKQELPMLDAMARRLKHQGIDVLAVSVDQERANVDKFLKGQGTLVADHRPRSRRPDRRAAAARQDADVVRDRSRRHRPLRQRRLRPRRRRRRSRSGLLEVAGN